MGGSGSVSRGGSEDRGHQVTSGPLSPHLGTAAESHPNSASLAPMSMGSNRPLEGREARGARRPDGTNDARAYGPRGFVRRLSEPFSRPERSRGRGHPFVTGATPRSSRSARRPSDVIRDSAQPWAGFGLKVGQPVVGHAWPGPPTSDRESRPRVEVECPGCSDQSGHRTGPWAGESLLHRPRSQPPEDHSGTASSRRGFLRGRPEPRRPAHVGPPHRRGALP